MTGHRIVDSSGALWPITGHRCTVCRMPLDPAVDDSIHPGCSSSPPISDRLEAQLIDHLAVHLGAVEMEATTTKEICMTNARSATNREDTLR